MFKEFTTTRMEVQILLKEKGITMAEARKILDDNSIYGEDGDSYYTLYSPGEEYGNPPILIELFEEMLKESKNEPIKIFD